MCFVETVKTMIPRESAAAAAKKATKGSPILTYDSAPLLPDHAHPYVKGLQIHCDLIM
jgi:hypothetical protein